MSFDNIERLLTKQSEFLRRAGRILSHVHSALSKLGSDPKPRGHPSRLLNGIWMANMRNGRLAESMECLIAGVKLGRRRMVAVDTSMSLLQCVLSRCGGCDVSRIMHAHAMPPVSNMDHIGQLISFHSLPQYAPKHIHNTPNAPPLQNPKEYARSIPHQVEVVHGNHLPITNSQFPVPSSFHRCPLPHVFACRFT
jgi:hypothetical protein